MKKPISKEVIKYGVAAATIIGLGAAVAWSLATRRRGPKDPTYHAPRMHMAWEALQGEPGYPAIMASVEPAVDNDNLTGRAFAALQVYLGDLPEGWQNNKLTVVRQENNRPWEVARTALPMGELYNDSEPYIEVIVPLGSVGLRAYLAHDTTGELTGIATHLGEVIPQGHIKRHYAEVPVIYT